MIKEVSKIVQLDNITDFEYFARLTTEIASVPAPPFLEEERGNLIYEMFKEIGYLPLKDSIGNVYVIKEGSEENNPSIVVAAHLDTVFPKEVKIEIKRSENLLIGPGVGDDSRGLTNLIFLAKQLFSLKTKKSILLLANVGEEGIGDLRGVKHLFRSEEHKNLASNIRTFITIDGSDSSRVVSKSLGSKRFEISFTGPGGHSFGAFGTVNPMYALGQFLTDFSKLSVPENPKTTFSVGVINGGTSVNSIPFEVKCQIDLRSESMEQIETLSEKMNQLLEKAVSNENELRLGTIQVEIKKIGDRPCGSLSPNSQLLKNIQEVHSFLNLKVNETVSSTDANIPQSMGIDAVSLAGSERAGNAHALDEWIDVGPDSLIPIKRNLLLLAVLASVYN